MSHRCRDGKRGAEPDGSRRSSFQPARNRRATARTDPEWRQPNPVAAAARDKPCAWASRLASSAKSALNWHAS